MTKPPKQWQVYLLRCSKDGSLYCGITNDIERRLREHQTGRGARYTAGRGPVEVVFLYSVEFRSRAQQLEAFIKRQRTGWKEALVDRSLDAFSQLEDYATARWGNGFYSQ